jgi:prepilin-type N-terminal cleavage/methylation domain-containing protein
VLKLKNNRGFSLIEILVIVAILGVALTFFSVSIVSLSAADARRCAVDMNSMMSRTKVNAMYRSQPSLRVYIAPDGRVRGEYSEWGEDAVSGDWRWIEQQDEILSNRPGTTVRFSRPGATDIELTAPGQEFRISFQRGTGTLLNIPPAGNPEDTEVVRGGLESRIEVIRGSTRYAITVINATGKHSVGR